MTDTKAICKQLIKDYCANCSFAGIHFIADDTKHWTERILWVVLVILSWYGSALLIIAAWEAFVLSPISFGVETVYIDWDTRMPTVAICENANDPRIYNVSDTIWTPTHLPDLEDALREIAFYRGVSRVLLGNCYLNPKPDLNCPMSNYSYYAQLIRSGCDRIMKNCSYNNEAFPCCEYFLPIETDMGPCFIINSVQTIKQHPYPMVKNMKKQEGAIKFDLALSSTCMDTMMKEEKEPRLDYNRICSVMPSLSNFDDVSIFTMYTLGEDEIPTITTPHSSTLKIQLGNSYRRILSIRNIENDPLIPETTTKQRACRFHDENEGGLYPQYSYSACTVLCRKQGQLQKCKCNDHFILNTTEEERCNITGMACLNNLANILTTLKPPWAQRPGLTCNCLPSCDETEVTVISDLITGLKGKAHKKRAPVEIILAYLPTERFKRNVVRSRLDLVVSVGGTTGLFVGASILSFVELFFFFTIRLFNNLWMNRKRQRSNNIKLFNSNYGCATSGIGNIKSRINKMERRVFQDRYSRREVAINSYHGVVLPFQN